MPLHDDDSPYANPNVRWILAGGSLIALAQGILWFAPTWLIYGLGGTNTQLGLILGSTSLTGIVFSIMASGRADRQRSDRIMRLAGLLMVIGTLLLSAAQSLWMVLPGMVLSQAGFMALRPTAQALLSNSTPSAARNRVFGTQFLFFHTATAIANLLLFAIYRGQGNDIAELDTGLIRMSIWVAVICAAAGTLLNFKPRDELVLTEAQEGSVATEHRSEDKVRIGFDLQAIKADFAPGTFPIINITLLSIIFIGFGAGISVPYFPRFFFDQYDLELSDLSLAFAGLTIFTAMWGKVTSNLADRFGRVQMVVFNQLIAVGLLYSLAVYPPLAIALGTLLLRNALMNGAWPVTSSLQMEYTPRRYRSQMAALTFNIFAATFAGGQMCGGYLADRVGFWLLFLITATLYLTSTTLYWRINRHILALPPRKERASGLTAIVPPQAE